MTWNENKARREGTKDKVPERKTDLAFALQREQCGKRYLCSYTKGAVWQAVPLQLYGGKDGDCMAGLSNCTAHSAENSHITTDCSTHGYKRRASQRVQHNRKVPSLNLGLGTVYPDVGFLTHSSICSNTALLPSESLLIHPT
jgi:hypothetical protein